MAAFATAFTNLANAYNTLVAAAANTSTITLTPIQTAAVADLTDQNDVNAANAILTQFASPVTTPTPITIPATV